MLVALSRWLREDEKPDNWKEWNSCGHISRARCKWLTIGFSGWPTASLAATAEPHVEGVQKSPNLGFLDDDEKLGLSERPVFNDRDVGRDKRTPKNRGFSESRAFCTAALGSTESADASMGNKEDPSTPDFWDVRFRQKRTPWDAGSTPPELEGYLIQNPDGGQVLIPGCGSAYEVRSFSEKGYEVVAIDFSQAAVERATAELGSLHTAVVLGDFFTHNFGPNLFDVIYERAFLASLPRRMWGDYAARVVELLRPGGRLIGFFVYGDQQGGPPFCLKSSELAMLWRERFEKVEDVAATTSVPVFRGKERWEVWIRKS